MANWSDGALSKDDIILKLSVTDHGCKDKFPLGGSVDGKPQPSLINFYKNQHDLQVIDTLNHIEFGINKPKRIRDAWVRLFVKDAKNYELARSAFRKLCKRTFGDEMTDPTPEFGEGKENQDAQVEPFSNGHISFKRRKIE